MKRALYFFRERISRRFALTLRKFREAEYGVIEDVPENTEPKEIRRRLDNIRIKDGEQMHVKYFAIILWSQIAAACEGDVIDAVWIDPETKEIVHPLGVPKL